MQLKTVAISAILGVASVLCTDEQSGSSWTDLKPYEGYLSGTTNFEGTFGIFLTSIDEQGFEISPQDDASSFELPYVSCRIPNALEMSLKDSVLRDSRGRIGSIVANQQFQFDGPPPQAGTIYASGWSLTPEGRLAIGGNDVFYRCLSGSFYNLYDSDIAPQCSKVYFQAAELIDC